MLIRPPYLKKNDKVAIIATAKKFSPEQLQTAIATLEGWGLQVLLGKNLYKEFNQFAGTDKERLKDLQAVLDNKHIKAVLCVRGGYGTSRIIDQLDLKGFKKSPKWVAGFSDVTVLHCHLQKQGFQSIHSTMPILFAKDKKSSVVSLKQALFGELINYKVKGDKLNRIGSTKGVLVGGNLSILNTLTGTESDIDTKGKILFIEDIDENFYHLDRMMVHLKRAGKLKNLAGLVVGHMTNMKDNEVRFGKTIKEIILDAVKEYKFPVCFNFPAGHEPENLALIMGAKVKLSVTKDKSTLEFI
jgi:muramoyltetrapeptide carboxypeptidase